VSAILSRHKYIQRKSGYKTAQVRRIILVFFAFVLKEMISGRRVHMPEGASFGIYKQEFKGRELPPISRKEKFKGKIVYATTLGRNRYKYRIIGDAGPAHKNERMDNHVIKLEGGKKMKRLLQEVLHKTTFEYQDNPWL
jgi:hypothetical protein